MIRPWRADVRDREPQRLDVVVWIFDVRLSAERMMRGEVPMDDAGVVIVVRPAVVRVFGGQQRRAGKRERCEDGRQ